MKPNILLTLVLLFCIILSKAQNVNDINAEPVKLKKSLTSELNKKFKDFRVWRINETDINNLVNLPANNLSFNLKLGDEILIFNIAENDLRGKNYKIYNDNVLIDNVNAKCITYKGSLSGLKGTIVRLTISDRIFEGYFKIGSDLIFIKPVWKFIKDYEYKNEYIFYKIKDILPLDGVKECGYKSDGGSNNKYSSTSISGRAEITCKYIEILPEFDYQYYLDHGSDSYLAHQSMVSTLNQVEGLYANTFNVHFSVPYTVGSTAEPDGYDPSQGQYSGSYSYRLLDDMIYKWENSAHHFDVLLLYTGISDLGVKGSSRYNVCKNVSKSYAFIAADISDDIVITTAHEIGHLLSATHPNDNSTSCYPEKTIMCEDPSPYQGRNFEFSQFSQDEINNHLNNYYSCLLDAEHTYIGDIEDPICSSESLDLYSYGVPVSVTSWSSNNPGLQMDGNTAIRQNNYNGYVTVTASGDITEGTGCTFETSKTFWVGAPTPQIVGAYDPSVNAFVAYLETNHLYEFHLSTDNPSTNDNDYFWNIIPPPESQMFPMMGSGQPLDFSASYPGYYEFKAQQNYVSCGWSNFASKTFYFDGSSITMTNSMEAYPNPTTNTLKLITSKPELSTYPIQYYLIDQMNQKIFAYGKVSSGDFIDVSLFPRGLYILKLTAGEEISYKKIILK